jgi:hypothetical protein
MKGAIVAWVCVAGAAYFAGCGSPDGSVGGDGGFAASGEGGSAGSAASGSGGSAAAISSGGVGASSNGGSAASSTGGSAAGDGGDLPDVTFVYDPPADDGGLDPDSSCAKTVVQAEPLPLDMYVILDKSGSMGIDCNVGSTGTSKWCYAINALYKFFDAPSSVGTGVALNFFSGSSCINLNTPQVAYNTLKNHLTQLQNALNAAAPSGGTPTSSAALGIASWTAANQKPGRKMIGLLITDGDPTSCSPTGVGQINTILVNHFNSTGVPTFVIGMTGATFSNLQTLANNAGAPSHTTFCGGGISPCHFYNVGNGDPQVFLEVLNAIQQTAIGCQYNVPSTDAGLIDWDKVIVQYTPGTGGSPQDLTRVDSGAQCGASGGWYYDNNNTPTTIQLCPNTCTSITTDSKAKIGISLGCLGS